MSALNPQPQEPPVPVDQNIPQWKRDLIHRRRATARSLSAGLTLTCPSVVAAVRQPEQHCSSSSSSSHGGEPSSSHYRDRGDWDSEASVVAAATAAAAVDSPDFHRSRAPADSQDSVAVSPIMRLVELWAEGRADLVSPEGGSVDVKMNECQLRNGSNRRPNKYRFKADDKVKETNGNGTADDGAQSDSSEELQYGPGIVKKLKSKYLSMTLRESQNKGVRPSLSNLRRATSLENLLDDDAGHKHDDHRRFIKRTDVKIKTRPMSGPLSRDSNLVLADMKRARSMETLFRSDVKVNQLVQAQTHSQSRGEIKVHNDTDDSRVSVQNQNHIKFVSEEEQTLLRKKLAITVQEAELPPPDVVKQTLKIFEAAPVAVASPRSVPKPNYNSAALSAVSNKNVSKVSSVPSKPRVCPKPVFSPEKSRRTVGIVVSPKKTVDSASASIPESNSSLPAVSPVSPVPPVPPVSPKVASPILHHRSLGLPILSPTEDKPPPVPRSREKSPVSSAPVTPTSVVNGNGTLRPETLDLKPVYSGLIGATPSVPSDGQDDVVDFGEDEGIRQTQTVPVSAPALENIRKDGVSMQFCFGNTQSNCDTKSYLPRVKPTPPKDLQLSSPKMKQISSFDNSPNSVEISGRVLPHGAVLMTSESTVQHVKQVGVIRPLVSTKHHNHSTSTASSAPLTNREIEKNLINRAKSIEQPVTKVVVSLKKLPDDVVVGSVSHSAIAMATNGEDGDELEGGYQQARKVPGLWDKKPWHQSDNTMVFNFSNRKEVPDYIENDGLILRSKREKPRPGEGGIILLGSGSGDSSPDSASFADEEDWSLVCSGPPSPCNVVFEGSNVLINGRSNIRKTSRRPKLRIQFSDEATTFEYPSEASLLEEATENQLSTQSSVFQGPSPSSLGCGSLASYTPSKHQMDAAEGFQLGVTRVAAMCPAPSQAQAASEDEDDFLKPAQAEESRTWSKETGADLLF